MLYIRVDANKKIATGHLMRCLSIAIALREKGEDTTFIVGNIEEDIEEIIRKNKFNFISINSDYNKLDEEIPNVIALISKNKIDKLLIDSYYVTKNYLDTLNKYTELIYIDDLNMFPYSVDLLINYNCYYEKFQYKMFYKKIGYNTEFLLGCEYAPLRKEFRNITPILKEKVSDILITTGGSDNYNVAGELLQYIQENNKFKNINLNVIVGKFNSNKERLICLQKQNSNIILHENVKKISKIMNSCDIAVSAAGSTLYELCACKTPSVCFTLADNQLDGAKFFSMPDKEIMYYVGDVRNDKLKCIEGIVENLEKLISNIEIRKEKIEMMKEIVDAYGTDRIAFAIKSMVVKDKKMQRK